MTDSSDFERRNGPAASEGVRILGAEEAQAVLDQRSRASSEPEGVDDDDLEVIETTDIVEAVAVDPSEPEPRPEPPEPRTVVRFPDSGPTWSSNDTSAAADEPSGEIPPLPHWTEPPTGALPAIFADDADDGDEDLDAWAAISASQPRFRAEGSDWADADFAQDELIDEAMKVGALAEATPIDEDEAFEDEIAQRRTRRGRPARTMNTGSGNTAAAAGAAAAATPAPGAGPGQGPARGPRRPPRPRDAEGVGAPPAPAPPSGRDLPTAIITAAAIVVVAFLCFTGGTFTTALLTAVIVALGTLEFTGALQHRGFRPASLLALVAAAGMPVAAREYGTNAYPVLFAVLTLFAMLWFLWEVTPGRPLVGVATTVLAFAYVGGLGGFGGLILQARDGVGIIIGVVACVVAYDVVGFFVGSQFGKSPIAPSISPNKTFEGTVAGMAASLLVGWLIIGGQILDGIAPWSPAKGAVLGLFVAAGAFLGDLCESMLKRDLGIKDFGSLLPGHGGVLDRFDGLLFCLPIAYFLSLHLNLFG